MTQQRPERVRVTSPWTERPRLHHRRTATSEIDAQSEVGEIYLRTLLRAQLRLALAVLLGLALTVGMLPLVFWLVPWFHQHHVLGAETAQVARVEAQDEGVVEGDLPLDLDACRD